MVRQAAALIALAGAVWVIPASAELQKIQVGGEIKIRGNYWSAEWFDQAPGISRGPVAGLFGRAIPDALFSATSLGPATPNPFGLPSVFVIPGLGGTIKFDDEGNTVSTFEQRTRLNVRADFSDNITAFIEVDSLEQWGEDFRSDYITGVDGRANSSDDVEIFQAWIEARNLVVASVTVVVAVQI